MIRDQSHRGRLVGPIVFLGKTSASSRNCSGIILRGVICCLCYVVRDGWFNAVTLTVYGLRFLVLVGALTAYRVSLVVEPLYRARPMILLEPVSILLPPSVGTNLFQTALVLLVIWLAESLYYAKALKLGWNEALGQSLRTYSPLVLLGSFVLLLIPGLPLVPMTGWWMLLDGSHWLLTLALFGVIYRKASFIAECKPELLEKTTRLLRTSAATIMFCIVILATLVALTPKRRFTQPYDERWGTGDEPRYVRIAASLLHDGNADIGNAAELIGKTAEPFRFVSNLLKWIPAAFRVLGEIPSALLGSGPEGEPRPLGGQVVEGRKGGTYYVYLPGFPLLLVPAMALDSFLHPNQLSLMLLTCLILGAATIFVVARLVEPYLESRAASYGLALSVGLTIPLFLHHFQAYPEVTAALCVSVMLCVLIARNLEWRWTFAFALAGVLTAWLHPKYYPIWGICVLGFVWKARRDKVNWRRYAVGVGLPFLSMAFLCLYIFHITGSLMPDTLWVLNGYPRGTSIINRTTPAGIYHLFFGSWQGLLVYGPLYVLFLPGLSALRRRSTFAFVMVLMVSVPYLLIAASHDLGGARGWIPASRYMVVLVPVFAIGIAAWLGGPGNKKLRWYVLFIGATASFWIALGMLEEPNTVYDRSAFLASRHVNVSPLLGTVLEPQTAARRIVYPALLLIAVVLFGFGERSRWFAAGSKTIALLFGLILIGGSVATIWSEPEEWVSHRGGNGPLRLRPGRSEYLLTADCKSEGSRLRFEGAGGSHLVSVRGLGLERHLRAYPTGTTELDISVEPIIRISGAGRRTTGWVELRLEEGQVPLFVRSGCP